MWRDRRGQNRAWRDRRRRGGDWKGHRRTGDNLRGIRGNGGDTEGQRQHGGTGGDMRGTKRDTGPGGDMGDRAGHWVPLPPLGGGLRSLCLSFSTYPGNRTTAVPPVEVAVGAHGVPKVPLGCHTMLGWAVQHSSSIQQLCLSREAGRSGCPQPPSPAGTPRMKGPRWGAVPGLWVLLALGVLGVLLGCPECLHREIWVSLLRVWVLWGDLSAF